MTVITPSGELALVFGNIAYPVAYIQCEELSDTTFRIHFITKQKI
jgi:hypothetical protein